jgi:lipopolysaccharide/colanic/teichoic acid biosynthesis glycosyltransferase
MEARGITQRQTRDREETESARQAEPAWQAALRRTTDFVVAGTVILLTAPILIIVAIAIRIDSPGPAIFRQRRVGRGEREFTLFKFRSMRVDADPKLHRDYVTALIHNGNGASAANGNSGASANGDSGGGLYKLAVDDRITLVGRFIRNWSLDELPQLFNVLSGKMTLVGPRPVIPYEVSEYPSWYRRRFDVKPGLTGLWQVSGRSERTYEEMVRLDIEYAKRRSLLLDISIFLKTPWVLLSRKGAEGAE